MESKHTPGPWHRNIRASGKYPVVFSGRNNYIANAYQQEAGADETEANIDLISAAPDLLAELEAACLFAEKEATRLSIECGMGASEFESFVPPWFGPSRAAIAKAKGD